MSDKLPKIIDDISALTVVEMADLVKALEENLEFQLQSPPRPRSAGQAKVRKKPLKTLSTSS